MTVSELIQLLSQFPADLSVRFVADDGYLLVGPIERGEHRREGDK
jgi:hypothetical protein